MTYTSSYYRRKPLVSSSRVTHTHTDTDAHTNTHTHTDRQTDRHRHRHRHRHTGCAPNNPKPLIIHTYCCTHTLSRLHAHHTHTHRLSLAFSLVISTAKHPNAACRTYSRGRLQKKIQFKTNPNLGALNT